MFASNIISRLTSSVSASNSPLLPVSSSLPSPSPSRSYSSHQTLSSPSHYTSNADIQASLLALQRQEAYLQRRIQSLLDIQSDGLLAGLGDSGDGAVASPASDTRGEASSSLPTLASSSISPRSKQQLRRDTTLHSSQTITPVRQPRELSTTSLTGARAGISNAISDLASLKHSQSNVLAHEISSRTSLLHLLDGFEKKKAGLEVEINKIKAETASDGGGIERMLREDQEMETEIRELEERLWTLKNRQRKTREDIQRKKNKAEARASSFRESLRLAIVEEQKLIQGKPPEWACRGEKEGGVWGLPGKRRTAGMVRESVEEEKTSLEHLARAAEREREALIQGGEMWNQTVREVKRLEQELGMQMARRDDDDGDGAKEEAPAAEKILARIRHTKHALEKSIHDAEESGWKLLIVCIGAELEALVQAEAVLCNALVGGDGDGAGVEIVGDDDASQLQAYTTTTTMTKKKHLQKQEEEELLRRESDTETHTHTAQERGVAAAAAAAAATTTTNVGVDDEEEEDDEPGPELLISSD
ncbi:MAG: hypothetical protein Q9190_001034 [Brigantiaea leucoxantha]